MSRARRLGLQALGYAFLALGVVGVFLPIFQGGLFFFIGLAILARTSPWAARLLARLERRFPRTARRLAETEARARAWLARRFRRG